MKPENIPELVAWFDLRMKEIGYPPETEMELRSYLSNFISTLKPQKYYV